MDIPKAIVVDTNVLIHDPESIYVLMNDINILFIHTVVLQELDKLKTKRDIGRDCREAIKKIESLHIDNNPRMRLVSDTPWNDNLNHLDKDNNDHCIIALAYYLNRTNEYKEVKLISRDTTVRILSRDIGLIAEDYHPEEVEPIKTSLEEVNVPFNIITDHYETHTFHLPNMNDYNENEGVVCYSDWNGYYQPQCNSEFKKNFVAVKKGELFHIVDREKSIMGINPYSIDGMPNWEQYVAMWHLMDKDIKLSFLIGGAGSGKTLLSLASAFEQRQSFRNILVTRPMVHLEDEDRMGFLPGDVNEKMAPWLRPIFRTISQIKHVNNSNQKIIQRIYDNNKLEIEPLDYIRGMTYVKDILIIDEAQNLTPHQMKTIITRAGEGSKLIFTGDLGQIDRNKKIDAKTNGLAYAASKMNGNKMVSVTNFKKTVRSPLAYLAEKLL